MDDLVCPFKEWSWGHLLSWEPHISKGMKAKMVFFFFQNQTWMDLFSGMLYFMERGKQSKCREYIRKILGFPLLGRQ